MLAGYRAGARPVHPILRHPQVTQPTDAFSIAGVLMCRLKCRGRQWGGARL